MTGFFDFFQRRSRNHFYDFKIFRNNGKINQRRVSQTFKNSFNVDIANNLKIHNVKSRPLFEAINSLDGSNKFSSGLFSQEVKRRITLSGPIGEKNYFQEAIKPITLKGVFKYGLDLLSCKFAAKENKLKDALINWDSPDQVLSWNDLSLDLAAQSSVGPTPCSRSYAYLNSAIYDAWAFLDPIAIGSIYNVDKQKNIKKLLRKSGVSTSNLRKFKKIYNHSSGLEKRALEAGLRAAVIDESAFGVLSDIAVSFFENGDVPQDLQTSFSELLDTGLDSLDVFDKKTASLIRDIAFEVGSQIATTINDYASEDGANQSGFYTDTTGYQPSATVFDPTQENPTLDSSWQPIGSQKFLTAQWGELKTFAINSNKLIPDTFISPYLPSGELDSAFISQLNEVVEVSQTLTAEQRVIAEFWEGGDFTKTPPGIWVEFNSELIRERDLNLEKAIFSQFNVSQALLDAGIAAWKVKTRFDSVRPQTSINQYYYNQQLPDGSLGQDFESYLPNPRFAEFVSGHSTFSAAAFGVMTEVYGSNIFNFEQTFADNDSRYSPNGFDGLDGVGDNVTLSIKYLSQGSQQAGASRIYGAIHFPEGDYQGQLLGTEISAIVAAKAKALVQGDDPASPLNSPALVFGTFSEDILTGLPQPSTNQTVHLYGFEGDDTLKAEGDLKYHLYGGKGADIFKVYGMQSSLIRDYELEDSIMLSEEIFSSSESISLLEVSYSSSGLMTDVGIGKRNIFSLDGFWNLEDINLNTFI